MHILKIALLLGAGAAASQAAAAPADILDAYRTASHAAAWKGRTTVEADYTYAGQGMTGTQHSVVDLRDGRFVDADNVGPMKVANGFDGSHAWAKDPSGTVTPQDGGDNLALSVNEAYRRANLWWRRDRGGAAIADDGTRTEAGKSYAVLTITPKGGKAFDAWFDISTHLLARIVEQQGPQLVTVRYSNYGPEHGARIARTIVINQGDPKYDQTLTLTATKFAAAEPASVYAMPVSQISDYAIAGGAHETTFPFRLYNNHIYADVSVNGKGPFQFVFDTGGVNLVTPPLAAQLGLKTEGHMQGGGAGAGHVDTGITKVETLGIGAATLSAQSFIVLPLNDLSKVEGVDEVGMVGFETFRRFVTRIDYGAQTITLIAPAAFDPKDSGTPIPIKFNGNAIEIDAAYDGHAGTFDIDTGNRSTLDLTSPFVAKYGLRASAGPGIETMTGWGVGGPTRSYATRGKTLAFGSLTLDHVPTDLSTDTAGAMGDASIAGNIGAGLLKRYVVTLDYGHAMMYLKPVTQPVADLDTFDRAGLWLNVSADGFAVVSVTHGAPAEDAGLKAGDTVVAVDGKPATGLKLYDIRRMLRDEAPGTVVTFTVKRDSGTSDVRVVLRDLI
jgi:hypothetical protein